MSVVGCDISKAWIDIHVLEPQRGARVANNAVALQRWAAELPAQSEVGMEATGTMHELLADTLVGEGHVVYVINPRWIAHYRRSLGVRGKTDRSDAVAIARFVAAERNRLHAYRPPTPLQRRLRYLLLRRQEIIKLRAATKQSLGDLGAALVLEFTRLARQIEHQIKVLLASDPEIKLMAKRFQTVPGIGPITAAHLTQVLTRIPFGAAGSFIAHTGLDPRPNDSGLKRGRRYLTHHGDSALRTTLFMAAMAACKIPAWRALFEANLDKGLPSTAAFVVVARKIARVAFSLYKSGQNYDPARVFPCVAS